MSAPVVEPREIPDRQRPVLVGGTGRSGSTIVGHLLDHHPDLTLTHPMEVRFITGNDGFADALAATLRAPGSTKAMAAARLAVDRLQDRWFQRAEHVGLHESMSRADVAAWSRDCASENRCPLRTASGPQRWRSNKKAAVAVFAFFRPIDRINVRVGVS